jgi:chromosome segregation ATPase
MRRAPTLLLAWLAAAGAIPAPARADSAAETRLREALRAATTQLRTLEDERVRWQASESSMKAEIESLRRQLAAARNAPRPSGQSLAGLQRRAAESEDAAARLKESLQRCEAALREAGAAREEERARAASEASALEKKLAASDERGRRLYQVAMEILQWANHIDLEAVNDPLLGLKRVEVENAAQDYEDRLREARHKP